MVVYKFAGFWRRLVAYSVDNIIINIVFFILFVVTLTAFIFGSMSGNSHAWVADFNNPERVYFIALLASALYIVMSIAYFTYFHGLKGRTPGKMLLGLQVLSVDGNPINFGIAFLRSVGYMVSSIFYIGFIWAAFDKRKQGWHDKIAGTVVIIRPDENEAAGLTIQGLPSASTFRREDEKQSETDFPEVIGLGKSATSEDKPIIAQPEVDDQKIP